MPTGSPAYNPHLRLIVALERPYGARSLNKMVLRNLEQDGGLKMVDTTSPLKDAGVPLRMPPVDARSSLHRCHGRLCIRTHLAAPNLSGAGHTGTPGAPPPSCCRPFTGQSPRLTPITLHSASLALIYDEKRFLDNF